MGPRSFWIQITDPKMWPAPTKTGAPYNFCFKKLSPNWTVEAAEARQALFRAPLTPGVGVGGQIPATNLPPIEEYTHANFIEIGPVVWISIADTHGTHIDLHIRWNVWNENKSEFQW
jgi:hypothetical protein